MKKNNYIYILKYRDIKSKLYYDDIFACYIFEIDYDTFYYETIEECIVEFIKEVDIIFSEDF